MIMSLDGMSTEEDDLITTTLILTENDPYNFRI